ncbi:hypothetical protein [Celeribacter arenosi]|uniref:Uncharacterized protein n=1 Tax=Celeribacter arenosi TaxID=792649 RepID=A0ABP7JWK4_9RHOB
MTQQESYRVEAAHSRNGGIYFTLGAIVVALGVVVYLMAGGETEPRETSQSPASVTITNDAPDNGASVSVTGDAPAATDAAPSE